MRAYIKFCCGGCSAETPLCFTGTAFDQARGHVEMLHELRQIAEKGGTEPGWMIGDPYTNCNYCPRCWAEIESPDKPHLPHRAWVTRQKEVPHAPK